MADVTWMVIDKRFLVIERIDRGTASGVRDVSFVLATSDLPDVVVPDIDDPDDAIDPDLELDPDVYDEPATPPESGEFTQPVVDLDPWGDIFTAFDLPPGGSLPWHGGAMFPDCCAEHAVAVTSVATS